MTSPLADALAERGYDSLTDVQKAVTAPELADADLLVSAQTGSGKTVGFGLAIGTSLLDAEYRLGPPAAPLALVVAPTRELALQVMRELQWLYAKAGARLASCVGGMDMRDERRALERGAHIVVGTPGRLVDHVQRGSLDLSSIRAVVLDEADEMLDMGFREDLEFMLGAAPEDRRTLMFSATVPPMIEKLAAEFQRDAVRVTTLSKGSQHADITYQALRVAASDAEHAIINLLRYHDAQNAIVFANTREAVNRLMARFHNRGFAVVSLSGELSQSERTHALQAMRDGRARVCVATDVAARGIDLPNLELVIHADLPRNSEALLHRSGRTGRAGRKGISAVIVTPRDVKKAERLLKWSKISAEWGVPPSADEIRARDEERLLADPVWSEEIGEEQAAFAQKLLALHSPETIAAAYLRLYHARQSAPEDLGDPDVAAPAKERAPFGPSVWFALSVGKRDGAEPRWLLPLVCRAANVEKRSIGAIRVQQTETFVEIAEGDAQDLLVKAAAGEELENGMMARVMDAPPEQRQDRPPRGKPSGPRPDRERAPRPDRKPRAEPSEASTAAERPASEPVAERSTRPAREEGRAERPAPREERSERPVRSHDKPREERSDRPARSFDKPRGDKPRGDKPRGDKARADKPRWDKPDGDKPARDKSHAEKPRGERSFGDKDKPYKGKGGKPYSDKPGGKGGPKGDKPFSKSKPAASARPAFDASDPSKRVVRPGKPGAKPAGKTTGKPRTGKPARGPGGDQPPRRKRP